MIRIGTTVKINIRTPSNNIPSLWPAWASKDKATDLPLGTGVAAGFKKSIGPLEEILNKVSQIMIINTTNERILVFISNSSKRVIDFHPSITRAKSGNSYQILTCHV